MKKHGIRLYPGEIKRRRSFMELNLAQFGRLLLPPVSPSMIVYYEKSENISPRSLFVIASALNCNPADLSPDFAEIEYPVLKISEPRPSVLNFILTMVRADHPDRWVPLTDSDQKVFDELWEGVPPGSADIGLLVDRAEEDGIPVVFRTDLPVKPRVNKE